MPQPSDLRTCRICGCTDDVACNTPAGPCAWGAKYDDNTGICTAHDDAKCACGDRLDEHCHLLGSCTICGPADCPRFELGDVEAEPVFCRCSQEYLPADQARRAGCDQVGGCPELREVCDQ